MPEPPELKSRRFRLAWRPTLGFAVLTQAPSLVVLAYFPLLRAAKILLTIALPYAALIFVLTLLICQIEVTEDGLTLNRVKVLPWEKIDRVAPSTVLRLRYVKAYPKGRRLARWFPLYLADEDGFRRAVIDLAPAANPLRVLLEGGGANGSAGAARRPH